MGIYHIKAGTALLEAPLRERIDGKLRILQDSRPLHPSVVARLREQFAVELTYHSNAIEGNTLTLKETFLVIREGLTVQGKPMKDHLEARDHYDALQFLYECVETRRPETLSEVFIRSIHQLVVRNSDREWAGRYRTGNVIITGANHRPPDASTVPALMRQLIVMVRRWSKGRTPIEVAALLHHGIVNIHPFFDGNGRTARLMMNLLLMQAGYPIAMILRNDRKKYYRVLSEGDRGRLAPFVRFVAQAVERSLNLYLKALKPARGASMFLPLSKISPRTPYSAKYLNLLARTGRIEAYKEKRDWLTSLEAVERYRRERQRKR
jgi:Fic family protein